jgi:hypothetical protein
MLRGLPSLAKSKARSSELNKFLLKLFFTNDKWVGVKLNSSLMVIVYTYKFIS